MQACRNEGWTQATAKSCALFVSHRMPWSPSVSQCHAKAINFRAIYTQTPALAGKALLGIKISEPPPTLRPPLARACARLIPTSSITLSFPSRRHHTQSMRAHIFATQAIAFSGRLVQRQQRAADHDGFKPQRSPHPLVYLSTCLAAVPASVRDPQSVSLRGFFWVGDG